MAEREALDSSLELPQPSQEDNNVDEDLPMADVQRHRSDAGEESESNSYSDSDSDDEAQQSLQIQTLETELSNNPSNYDAHVQYIRALRKHGDIEKLRQAREEMSAVFPLSPDMWQEWAKDEISLSSGSDAFPAIEKLYERGVSDYLSVSLWCDYVSFVQEYDPLVRGCSAPGITTARDLFERALTAAGLHVAEGSRIWESYREFEQAIFLTLDEIDTESREKQVQRIRNLFHRQLSVPLLDIEATLLSYKAWEVEQGITLDANSSDLDGLSSSVSSAYKKALEMLNARKDYEEQISKKDIADAEKLQNFMVYLKFEQSCGDPARIQLLYERAITEFPISNNLWSDYTSFMDKTLKTSSIVRDIYKRATRNCPWIGELWVHYLLSLERGSASEEELSSVFEKSLLCTFSSFDEYLDIFLTRIDGLRRRFLLAGGVENGLVYAEIRNTFQRASDYLSPHFKNTDSLLRIYSYWAHLERSMGKDLIAARAVWESLIKSSGTMVEAWKGYIAMEIETGHISEARSLFKRCYSKKFSGAGSEDICHSWLRFEREYGSLEDFDLALQKVTPRLEELQLFRSQQEKKGTGTSVEPRENSIKRNVREKRKAVSDIVGEQSPAKRQKDVAQKPRTSYGKDKGQIKDSHAAGRMEGEPQARKQETASKMEKELSPRKPKQYNDKCTAFISNLSLQATYDDLHKFFSDVGGVVAVRILMDKFTKKSRGLAYVDFSDEEHLDAAVAKNKQRLQGKKLSIARSDPHQSKKKGTVGSDAALRQDADNQTKEKSDLEASSKGPQAPSSSRVKVDDNIQLKGRTTFLPRAVRPLGRTQTNLSKSEASEEAADENPKSNDEFRKLFLKS